MHCVPYLALLASMVLHCHLASGRTHHDPHPKTADGARTFRQGRIEDSIYWFAEAEEELAASLARTENNNVAKNVIIFLGDGMSISTITAARIYKGQQAGQSGEEYKLSWEDFPDLGLSKTYSVNRQVPDSAATATAYLCGSKANYYTAGVDASVILEDCTTLTEESKVTSVAQWALDAGKMTGFVTSTRVSHATPSAMYTHTASRDWECDTFMPQDTETLCPGTKDIARQLIEDYPGRDFNVIMGGGLQMLTGDVTSTPGDPVRDDECIRGDGLDLFQTWQDNQAAQARNYAAVRSLSELSAVDLATTDYLMGIFANDHVPYEFLKKELSLDLPTLTEMTEAALTILSKGTEGFVLLVEGGRIDLAHHDGQANTAVDEVAMLDDAVRAALAMVDLQETLIIVTSDHSHPVSINGYPLRGTDITGIAGILDDDMPLATLTYTNGPGFNDSYVVSEDGLTVVRRNISNDDVTAFDYMKSAGAYRHWDTHEGGDVAIYAIGPMSHLFQRTHEQSYIAHVMGYAACIGHNLFHCN